ncbi:MAG TPA: hypothetical protein VIL60_12605 [Rhodanobacter sp.]
MYAAVRTRASNLYNSGKVPSTACVYDQRFSYCLYVPRNYDPASARLLVAVHGTERANQEFRDAFIDFSEENNLIVLAPLFPCGIIDVGDIDNYKYIDYEGIRFDEILLAMVREVESRYGIDPRPMLMLGFSGGAHFAHRFLYLHAEQLQAVSICAPGSPTLLAWDKPWWLGVSDFERRFGKPVDVEAMRGVSIHLAVGGDDTDTHEITRHPGERLWMVGANDSGNTRVERMAALAASLESAGISFTHDVLPGVRHERSALINQGIQFFKSLKPGAD